MNDGAREKGRAALYSMAGVYLLYLAYSIFKELTQNPDEGGIFVKIAMVAFVMIGAGMIGFGAKMMNDIHKRQKNEQNPEPDSSEEPSDTDK